MGFRFRKSIKMGPVRVNLSKSGVGYSVGGKGFRVTKRADGKVQTTASIPGTGISYVETHGSVKRTEPKRATRTGAATLAEQSSPVRTAGVYSVQAQRKTQKKSGGPKKWIAGIVAALLVAGGAGALLGDADESTQSGTLPQQVATQVAPEFSTEPESPEISGEVESTPEIETPTVESTPEPAPEPEPESEPAPEPEATPAPESEVTPSAPAVVPTAPAVTPEPEPVVTPTPQPEPEPEGPTVYVTKTGKRYHYDSTCNGGTYYASTLQKAQSRGLTPCNKCVQ